MIAILIDKLELILLFKVDIVIVCYGCNGASNVKSWTNLRLTLTTSFFQVVIIIVVTIYVILVGKCG